MNTPKTIYTTSSADSVSEIRSLDELNVVLQSLAFRAGWNKHAPSLWPAPSTRFQPAFWRWSDAKLALEAAGDLISTELADRRNLFMVNPREGNYYATLRTLVCAYQMILPGERARSHRHSPNALRLVLDVPENTYTVVDGVRIDMQPGDVVLTPNWCWHGHGNDGDRAAYWIDFLDVPLVQLLEPMFLEHWPVGFQDPEEVSRNAPYVFPWIQTERQLAEAAPDSHGRERVELRSSSLPTISLHVERVRADQGGRLMRSTANQIVACINGTANIVIEDQVVRMSQGDVVAVPSWHWHRIRTEAEATFLFVSDEATLDKLGFLRVEVE